MDSENFDEEGLLKVIKAFELSEAITKLNWNWNNYSNPIKDAHELMEKRSKIFSWKFPSMSKEWVLN